MSGVEDVWKCPQQWQRGSTSAIEHVLQVNPTTSVDNDDTSNSQVCAWHVLSFLSSLSFFLSAAVCHLCHTRVAPSAGAQVHGSNFLFWAIKRLVTMTGSDLAFCFWFPALLALSLAHCTYMALSIHLDELDDCASLDEQVQEEPTIMPPLQPHRELLPPRQPQTQFLPPRQPQTQVLPPQQPRTQVLPPRQPQAQVLPLQQVVPLQQVLPARQPQTQVLPPEQPQAQVLPTSQPQSHIMPAPQPQVQVVPHPPTLDPDHDVHRVITNSGGASQPEVSAHLASDLSHHQEQTASVQRRNPSLPEAAASQEGLQYEGPMPRQAAFRLPRIFRRREAPLMATTSPVELADVCVVCMDAGKDWLCVPCGHLAMCKACSARVKHQTGRCPVCQKKIKQVMQVYKV